MHVQKGESQCGNTTEFEIWVYLDCFLYLKFLQPWNYLRDKFFKMFVADNMTQQVRAPALRPEDLSWISGSHIIEEENHLLKGILWPSHAHCGTHMHTVLHSYMHTVAHSSTHVHCATLIYT